MVVEGPLAAANSRTMIRSDNARAVSQSRYDDSDRPRVITDHNRVHTEAVDVADKTEVKASALASNSNAGLSQDETLELFQRKVADARNDNEQALESEGVTSAFGLKLTLNLGHSNITCLPDSVVDLLEDEVDKLSLSHNQISLIPSRFSDCTHLRYLNIRSNAFREIPKAVFKLPSLEILDISRNKVRIIPPQVSRMTALRVLALVSNRVEDLPTELCEMKKLQILKIADNPLRSHLKSIIDAKERDPTLSGLNEHERETIITAELKKFLGKSQSAVTPIDLQAAQSSEEPALGTPKPGKRNVSGRFSVIPSNFSSGDASNEAKSSPNQGIAPPVPARSHFRIGSGQGLALKRPTIAPLIASNERNRSNSEGLLQATANVRPRRVGMLTKPKPDLDSIEETKANRNSHLRGFSHASILKRGVVNASPVGNGSSPNSPREPKQRRPCFVRKLSSLPEHKTLPEWNNPTVQGAKGVLYALYQIHPHLAGLIAATKNNSRRTSLEITFYASSTHVDRLNEALEMADVVDLQDEEAVERVEERVQEDCKTCVMAYTHVFAQLQDSVRKIVNGTDARYVRTLMLLLYGSILEIRNAMSTFGYDVKITQAGHKRQRSSGAKHTIQTIPEEYSTPMKPTRFETSSQDGGAVGYRQPGTRFRSDTAIQHPMPDLLKPTLSTTMFTPTHLSVSTATPDPLGNMGSSYSSTSFSFRSRSNSRNASQTSTAHSSVGSTPRSVEALHTLRTSPNQHQVNPLTGLTDVQEEAAFSPIYLSLTRSFEAALQAIPPTEKHFKRCLQEAKENHRPRAVQELWLDLVQRCRICFDASEALRLRLTNMNMKSPEGGRNDPSFWLLCKTFLQSFVELVTEMREARNLRLLPQELILVLRPVQKTSREAGRLIDSSPWRGAADGATTAAVMPTPSSYLSANGGPSSFMRNDGYSFNNNNNNNNNIHHNNHAMHNGNGNGNGSKDSFSSYSSALSQQHHMYPASNPLGPLSAGAGANPPSTMTTAPAVQPISLPSLTTSYTAGFPPSHHLGGGAASSHHSPLPSTPLSAALGPAAQATVPTSSVAGPGGSSSNSSSTAPSAVGTTPSTPAIGTMSELPPRPSTSLANSNDFFKGDVFQRADSLLSMPQPAMAGGMNFFSVRR